ncbi:MAG TPA: nucleotide sugar dehydrogenase [Pseudolysinimonas sp.]
MTLTREAPPSHLAGLQAHESALPSSRPMPVGHPEVAIVGLGYVGLPTALAYHHGGKRVLGLEVSESRIATIRAGGADLLSDDRARLERAMHDDGFELSSDPRRLAAASAVIICVPTPVDSHLVPDLTILRAACRTVVENAVAGQLIMLTSTTYVGCTNDLIVVPLQERGFVIGKDIFVAFSAERIDPGNGSVEHEEVPRVVGGATLMCEVRASLVLKWYVGRVHRLHSLAAAEMTKLLENTFRAVNIALANEFADICSALDIPVTDVIDAASTKPYGFMRFLPGPGVGGHCIPCDPHYLLWQLKERRIAAPMITQAMTSISERPTRVVDRARQVLSDRGLGLGGARVLVVGVAYKPDVADLRESPALEILAQLAENGATVGFVDPLFRSVRLHDGSVLDAVDDPAAFGATLVILHTRHSDADLDWIGRAQLVLDATYSEVGPRRRIAV